MPTIKRIAILGAGAMGGAYAAMLDTASEFETMFVARGRRAERLAQDGLIVNGKTLHLPVVRPDQTTAPADLVMVALKHHHLNDAGAGRHRCPARRQPYFLFQPREDPFRRSDE